MPPELRKVIRLDSLPLQQTQFTPEGYFKDRPILTRTGIFEYANADGTIRRELRLPEDVFDAESLSSYKGKPIIITHSAGEVTKDNVHKHQIGTILTEGYRSGENVRAEIIIHDMNAMRDCGLRELSLGYKLDLEEKPGVWQGMPYDARQRNIRINHLAVVRDARAGESARLNLDSRDKSFLKGGKPMSMPKKTAGEPAQRSDGVLSQEEFAKAVAEYMAKKAKAADPKADADDTDDPVVVSTEPEDVVPNADSADEPAKDKPAQDEPAVATDADDTAPTDRKAIEEKVADIKERFAKEDGEGEIRHDDMKLLFDIIDTLLAKMEFDSADEPASDDEPVNQDASDDEPAAADADPEPEDETKDEPAGNSDSSDEPEEVVNDDGADCKPEDVNADGDDNDDPEDPADDVDAADCNDTPAKASLNQDAMDEIIRTRVQLGLLGRQLNLDGLEDWKIMDAKKAITSAIRPGMRLDGKSEAFINAAFEYALADFNDRKENAVDAQKKQMFNKDSRTDNDAGDSSMTARQRMIERQQKK